MVKRKMNINPLNYGRKRKTTRRLINDMIDSPLFWWHSDEYVKKRRRK